MNGGLEDIVILGWIGAKTQKVGNSFSWTDFAYYLDKITLLKSIINFLPSSVTLRLP